jgi:hypothetical protein
MGGIMPSFKETEEDGLGRYIWLESYGKNMIKYYPEHGRYACVHVQARHGDLIAATAFFVRYI